MATVGSRPFDTVSVRLNSAFLHDAIALAEHDDAGLPVLDLMFGDMGEAHDGEDDFRLPYYCTGCARKV